MNEHLLRSHRLRRAAATSQERTDLPSARQGALFGNGRTAEDLTDPDCSTCPTDPRASGRPHTAMVAPSTQGLTT